MANVRLEITKNVEQNASAYFERSKKLKSKTKGAREAIAKMKRQLGRVRPSTKPSSVLARPRRKAWYEKFRWFISSEGFLVIGGRDATSNEIVIKKHAEQGDLVLHTDMAGSPFFVVKSGGKVPGEQTVMEAADATASFGRAWKRGLPYIEVFCVRPEQVSKQAQSGEYLPKGAFMIRGKTKYVENRINVAIGLYKGAVMAGPKEAVQKHCETHIEIIQGERKTSDMAKRVQKRIGGELDDIVRAMPAGGCDIKSQ
jgi:predicted ribosome quality control (RQC) complex YloA/Tae2 family protein